MNVVHVVTNNSLCSCTSAAAVRLLDYLSCVASGRVLSDNSSASDELVDELFTIFDDVRMTAVNITDTMLKFIGELLSFYSVSACAIC
jgi:DNA-directed RNA polymerase subunit F